MTHFTVHQVDDAGQPFNDNGGYNDYSCFGDFSGNIGVYVFQRRDPRKVLYVGKSDSPTHPLNARIPQHYTIGGNAGHFRINWCRENCEQDECGDNIKGKKICSAPCNSSFMNFKCLVRESRLIVFSFGRNGSKPVKIQIDALESALIGKFRPTWNSGELKARRISSVCVQRAVTGICNLEG